VTLGHRGHGGQRVRSLDWSLIAGGLEAGFLVRRSLGDRGRGPARARLRGRSFRGRWRPAMSAAMDSISPAREGGPSASTAPSRAPNRAACDRYSRPCLVVSEDGAGCAEGLPSKSGRESPHPLRERGSESICEARFEAIPAQEGDRAMFVTMGGPQRRQAGESIFLTEAVKGSDAVGEPVCRGPERYRARRPLTKPEESRNSEGGLGRPPFRRSGGKSCCSRLPTLRLRGRTLLGSG
jgi:hypothetical protein